MDGKSINRRKKINTHSEKSRKNEQKDEEKPKTEPNLFVDKANNQKKNILYVVIIMIITFAVFSPTFKNSYTNWDDGKYVNENPLIKPLDTQTIKKIFASEDLGLRYWMGNYHPLTMLSLNINYAIAQKDTDGNAKPFTFQLINILLHILNTLLVFLIIKKLFKNVDFAFIVGLLFGIHTLHVESVTWIAERKDVLYTFLYLSALLFYVKYTEKLQIKNYILALILLIISSLSKGQAVSFALTIILVDYFKDRKLLSRKVILEKIPFLVTGLIFGLIAIEAQKQGNALQVINSTPLFTRFGVAGYGFTMYILKLILPIKLCAVYPYPDIVHQTIPLYYWLGLISAIGTGLWAVKSFKNNKIILFGIGFFVLNIVFLLQLIPVGSAIYADRYAYIPSIGFFVLVAYFLLKIKDKKVMYGMFAVYVVLLSFLTVNRVGDWKDSLTLWQDVIKKQPKSVVAWNNLGSEYNRTGERFKDEGDFVKYQEYTHKAIECFTEGIKRKPDYTSAFYNKGFSEYNLGIDNNDTTLVLKSIEDFNHSIATDLEFFEAYQQRGIAYDWLGMYDKAIIDYNYVLQYRPRNLQVIVNRGITKGKTGDLDGAIDDFNLAISINPETSQAYSNRGLAYAFKKQYDLALADYNKALEYEQEGNTYYNRGMAYYNLGEYQQAIDDFNRAISVYFNAADVYFYKAVCEKNLGQNNLACDDMQIAANMNYQPALNNISDFCQ